VPFPGLVACGLIVPLAKAQTQTQAHKRLAMDHTLFTKTIADHAFSMADHSN
jgi:hypothetical protein